MKKQLLVIALLCLSCTSEDRTVETVAKYGLTDVKTHGYAPFSCGEDDTFATRFSAVNSKGARVSGVVCCGVLKSCTVRF